MIINPSFRGLTCTLTSPVLEGADACSGTWYVLCGLSVCQGRECTWHYRRVLIWLKSGFVVWWKSWISLFLPFLQAERNAISIRHRCFPFIPEANFFFFLQQFWWNYVSLVIIHFKNSWAVWRTFMKIHLDKIRYYCLMRWHFNLDLASCIYQEFFME